MLEAAIEKNKALRVKFTVTRKDGYVYQLYTADNHGKMIRSHLDFYKLERLPDCHDNLYFSEHLFDGMNEGLFSYQFSAEIGGSCAREPHNFLLEPAEFLILEYSDGTTTILEEVYG